MPRPVSCNEKSTTCYASSRSPYSTESPWRLQREQRKVSTMHVHTSNADRKSIKSVVHPRHSAPASRHGKQPPPSTLLGGGYSFSVSHFLFRISFSTSLSFSTTPWVFCSLKIERSLSRQRPETTPAAFSNGFLKLFFCSLNTSVSVKSIISYMSQE